LLPENKGQLTDILLYHVDDRVLMAGVDFHQVPTTSNQSMGQASCITSADGGVTIADGTGEMAAVIITNIRADNGVIH
jgi:uncharacterized surface protein with fasciclin (FAS1) repeats